MKAPLRIVTSLILFVASSSFPLANNVAANSVVPTASLVSIGPSPTDLEVAARFAPIFYQALGDKPRSDYITNFDFDGDWRGDNNWANLDNRKFPLLAYVYYSVCETATHYFIHYALFHPRDYKGGETKGRILSDLIREGTKRGTEYDPTGWMEEAGVAHENDLEGCLLVVAKQPSAHLVFVETLHHNTFSPNVAGEPSKGFGQFQLEDGRVRLYVEPKGHGIEVYSGDEKQTGGKQFMTYLYRGQPEDPEKQKDFSVGYALLPIKTTLWAHAKGARATSTFGIMHDYGELTVRVVSSKGAVTARKIKIGKVGQSFLGKTGGVNMARAPWAWFDKDERDAPLGLWFFDPAIIIKRDFRLDESFSTAYLRLPFWAN